MMKKSIIAVSFVLLLILSIHSSAGNISLSSSIATHIFDTLDGDVFVSNGKFIINNQENTPITLKLSVQNTLDATDLNVTTKEPRTHKVNNTVFMHEAPTTTWITFPQDTITIEPKSSKEVSYNISIPVSELPSYIGKHDGFLMYITISGTEREGDGSTSVGVNYKYKVFTIFKEQLPSKDIPLSYLIVLSLISALIVFYINDKLQITKKIKQKRLKQ